MAKTLQLRRGTTAEITANTPASGELFVDTEKNTVNVGDGSTPGGIPLALSLSANNTTSNTLYFPLSNTATGTLTQSIVANNILTFTTGYQPNGGISSPTLRIDDIPSANAYISVTPIYVTQVTNASKQTRVIAPSYDYTQLTQDKFDGSGNYNFFGAKREFLFASATQNNTPVYLTSTPTLSAVANGASSASQAGGYYMVNGEMSKIKIKVAAARQPTTSFPGLQTWERDYIVYRVNNTTTFLEESNTTTNVGTTTGWDAIIDGTDYIGIKVTGDSANVVYWTGTLEYVGQVITGAGGGK